MLVFLSVGETRSIVALPLQDLTGAFINIPLVQQFLCPFTVWIQRVGT